MVLAPVSELVLNIQSSKICGRCGILAELLTYLTRSRCLESIHAWLIQNHDENISGTNKLFGAPSNFLPFCRTPNQTKTFGIRQHFTKRSLSPNLHNNFRRYAITRVLYPNPFFSRSAQREHCLTVKKFDVKHAERSPQSFFKALPY